MRKLIATIGFLLVATASHGEAGQHTGVGGNPAVPPPQPTGVTIPPNVIQSLILRPGMIIFMPELQEPVQDPANDQNPETDKGDDSAE